MIKCYNCGNNVVRKKYSHCPYCGKCLRMTSTKRYLLTLADSAQANRIELILKEIKKELEKKE